MIGNVAGTTELTKENAKKVINAVLEGIFTILEQSGKLRLVNFGTFSVKKTKERQGINPKRYCFQVVLVNLPYHLFQRMTSII